MTKRPSELLRFDEKIKIRKRPPKKGGGGDYRNVSHTVHVPKNKYQRISRREIELEALEEWEAEKDNE